MTMTLRLGSLLLLSFCIIELKIDFIAFVFRYLIECRGYSPQEAIDGNNILTIYHCSLQYFLFHNEVPSYSYIVIVIVIYRVSQKNGN